MIKLVIPGEPTGKGRPRLGKFGNVHTPTKTLNYEGFIKWIFIQEKCKILEGPIKAEIKAFYSIPASTSNKKLEQMRHDIIRPTKKPDLDNVAKICLDSLNKLAFHDDSEVVSLLIEKFYSDEPRVEIILTEM